ncbi:unnamed protein product [Litomosoides sigmodontis]|uniref:Zinc transporter ZIP13 n=1 Tax=Litomosoides sigmodontis TaxID=42156 RepID=A0A3P6TEE7_LITSI|nr:unnamed protein product [Litomosoides sigmodontis]
MSGAKIVQHARAHILARCLSGMISCGCYSVSHERFTSSLLGLLTFRCERNHSTAVSLDALVCPKGCPTRAPLLGQLCDKDVRATYTVENGWQDKREIKLKSADLMELDQLPAPDIGDNDVLPEVLLTTLKKTSESLNAGNEIPPDTLIDPDGRIVAFSKQFGQKYAEELQEERKLLREIAKKDGKELASWKTCIWTALGCICIVACGIAPAFLLPNDLTEFLQSNYGRRSLRLLLSFAVGSLIGDVFLHLLPTIWADTQVDRLTAGAWTTAGVLLCFILEKLCLTSESGQRRICAILNLIANFMDNFTHGLAVGGSFLMDTKLGLLTTFSIVIHELPHEIGDFAILLSADFNRRSAVRAQLLTAIGGALGAWTALFLHNECAASAASQHILPFTAGGFINIALAQMLPELMKETDSRYQSIAIYQKETDIFSGFLYRMAKYFAVDVFLGWHYTNGCAESISSPLIMPFRRTGALCFNRHL